MFECGIRHDEIEALIVVGQVASVAERDPYALVLALFGEVDAYSFRAVRDFWAGKDGSLVGKRSYFESTTGSLFEPR